jgi:hypothetical protein
MPIPKKNKDEDKTKFVARCMGDNVMKKDYPSNSQRVAICLDQATADCDCVEAADFKMQLELFGYEEDINDDNFYIPTQAEYEDFGEETEEWDVAEAKPGLWENIRKKKERLGKKYKPAKPGDPDRPDKDAFKKAQSGDSEMAVEQIMKMGDQIMEIVTRLKTMQIPVEFQDWTKDMISKAEIYIQNVYDFVKYYEPGKYEDEYTNEVDEPSEMETEDSYASEYQGRKVTLNKPFRTSDGPKKFGVYVKNESGNVVIVRFGDPNMTIKKDIPERRKSFRARMQCDNPGPKWKARYWACKSW